MTVLVAAASKHGATSDIAEAIGRGLRTRGIDADVKPIFAVDELDGYDAFVLGSGVYAGKWLGPARRFVESHAVELADRPTWLFSSGPIGDPPKPEEEKAVKAEPLVELTQARGHRVFAGRLEKDGLSLVERAVASMVRSTGDFRDWHAIDAWAEEIAGGLRQDLSSERPN